MRLERRVLTFEVRATEEAGDERTFEGYGSVFDAVDAMGDAVAKGAFRKSLATWRKRKKLPKLLLQHGGGFFGGGAEDLVPIGKWTDMREDDVGLFVRGRLFDTGTDRANDTYAALKEGELDGLSIGFRTKKSKLDEETQIRTLTEIELWEVSLVTFPANDPARVTDVRSGNELPTERDFERWIRREGGFSDAQAKVIIAKGYRQVRREAIPPADIACGDVLALLKQRATLPTGG